MKRRFLAILLASVLLGSSSLCVLAESGSEIAAEDSPAILEESSESLFLDSLDKSIIGGVYMNDNDELCISSIDTENLRSMLSRAKDLDTNKIRIEKAEYSLQELEAAKQILLDNLDELEITAVGFNEKENSLAVYLFDPDEQKKAKIRQKSPVENIIFYPIEWGSNTLEENIEQNENDENNTMRAVTKVYGGQWLLNDASTTKPISSIGYRAKKGTQYGYVTCGHDWTVGKVAWVCNLTSASNFTQLGKVSQNKKSGKVDASFIPSNMAWGGLRADNKKATKTASPIGNRAVIFDGAKHYTQGINRVSARIQGTSVSGVVEGVSFSDLFTLDAQSLGGDSGAAVLQQNTTGSYDLIGFVKSTWWRDNNHDDYALWTAGSKWSNVASAFGLSFVS